MAAEITRVLIADDDLDFCYVCAMQLKNTSDIECCGFAYDGKEACQKIKETQPDVLILDFNMPVIDGLDVVDFVAHDPYIKKPKILAVSINGSNVLGKAFLDKGASCFLTKPINTNTLVKKIRLLSNLEENEKLSGNSDKEAQTLENKVALYVIELGIPTKLTGSHYVQLLLCMLIKNDEIRPTLSQMYSDVAAKCNTGTRCVENAVMCAIKHAFKKQTPAMKELLMLSFHENVKSLSNGQFLTLAAQAIKLRD